MRDQGLGIRAWRWQANGPRTPVNPAPQGRFPGVTGRCGSAYPEGVPQDPDSCMARRVPRIDPIVPPSSRVPVPGGAGRVPPHEAAAPPPESGLGVDPVLSTSQNTLIAVYFALWSRVRAARRPAHLASLAVPEGPAPVLRAPRSRRTARTSRSSSRSTTSATSSAGSSARWRRSTTLARPARDPGPGRFHGRRPRSARAEEVDVLRAAGRRHPAHPPRPIAPATRPAPWNTGSRPRQGRVPPDLRRRLRPPAGPAARDRPLLRGPGRRHGAGPLGSPERRLLAAHAGCRRSRSTGTSWWSTRRGPRTACSSTSTARPACGGSECIDDAGGWQHDTLTEDLDLSYRAQLAGWRFVYLRDVTCPAELPVDMRAFKSQQFRWVKGSVQVARKILPRIWRSSLPLAEKLECSVHLTQNLSLPARPGCSRSSSTRRCSSASRPAGSRARPWRRSAVLPGDGLGVLLLRGRRGRGAPQLEAAARLLPRGDVGRDRPLGEQHAGDPRGALGYADARSTGLRSTRPRAQEGQTAREKSGPRYRLPSGPRRRSSSLLAAYFVGRARVHRSSTGSFGAAPFVVLFLFGYLYVGLLSCGRDCSRCRGPVPAPDAGATPRVSLVIPALNEEESLPLVLDGAAVATCCTRSSSWTTDRPTGPREVARERGRPGRRGEPRRGYGSACLAGIAALDRSGHRRVPRRRLLRPPGRATAPCWPRSSTGRADLVIGSRMTGERERGRPASAGALRQLAGHRADPPLLGGALHGPRSVPRDPRRRARARSRWPTATSAGRWRCR